MKSHEQRRLEVAMTVYEKLTLSLRAFIGTLLGDLFGYALLAGGVWLMFYVVFQTQLRHRRISNRTAQDGQVAREIAHSLRSIAIFGLVTCLVVYAAYSGWTRLYLDVRAYGWGWFVASIGVMIVIHDAYFYWTHRLMHQRWLYPWLHRTHHLSTSPTPWAAYAFSPGEALVQAGIGPLLVFTLPIHPAAFGLFMAWQLAFNVMGHCGYEIFPRWFLQRRIGYILNCVTHHALHHEKFQANYGLYFNLWDRLMHTNHPDYADRFELATPATDRLDTPAVAAGTTRSVARTTTLVLFAMLLSTSSISAADTQPLDWAQLRDIEHQELAFADSPWKVVCFLGTECPLARLYGPRLNALAETYQSRGVAFIGINSNPQDTAAKIQRYIRDHGLGFPVIKDADQALARRFQATRTPEVFVIDASNVVRYQGRVDDQYEPGRARSEPTQHDLRNALDDVLEGHAVRLTRTTAVGCLMTQLPASRGTPAEPTSLTFTRDIAPILNRRCVDCHRPGEIGPFSLTDYDEVIGWGEMMLEVIDQGRMPPWHADLRHGSFVGQRLFPAAERETLAAWVHGGMPRGDLADLPDPPQWSAGWHLPQAPDEELVMRERPFVVPSEGTVEYQYFVVNPGWTEDRWVSAAQVIPGAATVVHHAIVFVRPPDGANAPGIGWLGAYVPGQRAVTLPPGHARRVPAGSKLIFQMHYTPTGRETADATKLGVWFRDSSEVTHEVFTRVALNHEFEIPPDAEDHPVEIRLANFAQQSRLLGVMPHMHLRGKSFLLTARHGSERETLLSVPQYDFNWQHWYQFESPLALDDLDALEMTVRFDNSSGNPTNPAPDAYVTWGDQTWEEMAVAFFDVAHPRDVPLVIARASGDEHPEDPAARQRRIQQSADEFLKRMDRNGDGVVTRDEAPTAFRRFGFRKMDTNRDDRLDRSEIEAAAAQRL